MSAASIPSNTPALIISILPPPPSSAGVPSRTTSPPAAPATEAAATNAPAAPAAMRLWPQAWPTPGRASYSARIATRAPPPAPARDRSAVGMPATPRSTEWPRADTNSPIHALARCSSKRSSGWAWMRPESASSSSAHASTARSIEAASSGGRAMAWSRERPGRERRAPTVLASFAGRLAPPRSDFRLPSAVTARAAAAAVVALGIAAAACRDAAPSSSGQPVVPASGAAAQAPAAAPEAALAAPTPTAFAAEKVTAEGRAMGTHLAFAAFTTPAVDAARVRAAFDAAIAEIMRIEKRMTTWDPTSEVSRINAAAGKEPVAVSDETFDLVRESLRASQLSDGAFDITFETLHGLWKFDQDLDSHPPTPDQ